MSNGERLSLLALLIVMLGMFAFFTINIGKDLAMGEAKYTLETYTGVGSGVYKHGTIVKVVDGQPVVVGSFHDDSGKDYPGTVEIQEVGND